MARRRTRQPTAETPEASEPTADSIEAPDIVVEPETVQVMVEKEVAPTIKERVTVTLLKGNGLVHPCGTRLLPNDPADIPYDSWTKAQAAAGLLSIA